MPSQTLYGVPERESSLLLTTTSGGDPYRMFATDEPFHKPEIKVTTGRLARKEKVFDVNDK